MIDIKPITQTKIYGLDFYLLELDNGQPPLSGFVYIKRRTN